MRVVVAPGRAHRPGAFMTAEPRSVRQTPEQCPFCVGHEDRTPPETLVLAADDGGWGVRVVPNLFPALEAPDGAQEVVVHAPRHATAFHELSEREVERVCAAWALRAQAHAEAGYRFLFCSINDGAGSGASLDHTHSQLTATALAGPLVSARLARFRVGCPICAELAAEGPDVRTVAEAGGVRVYAPWASATPYQLRAAPLRHHDDGLHQGPLLATALRAIATIYSRTLGTAPWNAWLHTRPLAGGDDGSLHWHVEALPRVTVLASLELGAGLPICSVDPDDAAAAMRG
jgi:UDPglucose--hexose-1-phosphate uridylyltransferase